jgi:hypothetical protein
MPCDMIKTRAQVVNDFTNENAESRRDRQFLVVLDCLKESLVVVLGKRGVLAFLKKPLNLEIEIDDVLVGPI